MQVDSVVWVKPRMLERIARDLSGALVTRAADAFADEWHPDMGDTEKAFMEDMLNDEQSDDPHEV